METNLSPEAMFAASLQNVLRRIAERDMFQIQRGYGGMMQNHRLNPRQRYYAIETTDLRL